MRSERKLWLLTLLLVLLILPASAEAAPEKKPYYPETFPYNPYHEDDTKNPFDLQYPCPVCGVMSPIVNAEAPTCSKEGFVTYRCYRTDQCSVFTINIRKLGHAWNNYSENSTTCSVIVTGFYYCPR